MWYKPSSVNNRDTDRTLSIKDHINLCTDSRNNKILDTVNCTLSVSGQDVILPSPEEPIHVHDSDDDDEFPMPVIQDVISLKQQVQSKNNDLLEACIDKSLNTKSISNVVSLNVSVNGNRDCSLIQQQQNQPADPQNTIDSQEVFINKQAVTRVRDASSEESLLSVVDHNPSPVNEPTNKPNTDFTLNNRQMIESVRSLQIPESTVENLGSPNVETKPVKQPPHSVTILSNHSKNELTQSMKVHHQETSQSVLNNNKRQTIGLLLVTHPIKVQEQPKTTYTHINDLTSVRSSTNGNIKRNTKNTLTETSEQKLTMEPLKVLPSSSAATSRFQITQSGPFVNKNLLIKPSLPTQSPVSCIKGRSIQLQQHDTTSTSTSTAAKNTPFLILNTQNKVTLSGNSPAALTAQPRQPRFLLTMNQQQQQHSSPVNSSQVSNTTTAITATTNNHSPLLMAVSQSSLPTGSSISLKQTNQMDPKQPVFLVPLSLPPNTIVTFNNPPTASTNTGQQPSLLNPVLDSIKETPTLKNVLPTTSSKDCSLLSVCKPMNNVKDIVALENNLSVNLKKSTFSSTQKPMDTKRDTVSLENISLASSRQIMEDFVNNPQPTCNPFPLSCRTTTTDSPLAQITNAAHQTSQNHNNKQNKYQTDKDSHDSNTNQTTNYDNSNPKKFTESSPCVTRYFVVFG